MTKQQLQSLTIKEFRALVIESIEGEFDSLALDKVVEEVFTDKIYQSISPSIAVRRAVRLFVSQPSTTLEGWFMGSKDITAKNGNKFLIVTFLIDGKPRDFFSFNAPSPVGFGKREILYSEKEKGGKVSLYFPF